MAQKEGSDVNFVTKLISASKTLTNANILKGEYELILKELTLFKNFTSVFYKPSSSGVQNILTITAKLISDSSVQQTGENILITVCNNSSAIDFSPKFWQLSIEYFDGVDRRVSSWKLEEPLAKGKSYNFVVKFVPDVDFRPIQIKVNFIFTLLWKEDRFVRVLPIGSVLIDVMYFLNPGRLFGTLSSPSSSTMSSIYDLCRRLQGHDKLFSTVTMFEFQFDSQLTDLFINEIFLRDSLHRGFPSDFVRIMDEKSSPTYGDGQAGENIEVKDTKTIEFAVYVQSEKISISYPKNGGSIVFKCSNSKLLFSVKAAIFHRLLSCDGIKVVCPDDKTCEKLYSIKLILESKHKTLDSYEELMKLYLQLRDISESVKFIKLSSIE